MCFDYLLCLAEDHWRPWGKRRNYIISINRLQQHWFDSTDKTNSRFKFTSNSRKQSYLDMSARDT